MSESFELREVDHLTIGTVGLPGQRVFYLQARSGERLVSFKLEKGQVAALVRYLQAMLEDLPPATSAPATMELVEPVVPEWVVGALGVSYDEVADRVIVLADELVEEDEDGAVARFHATRDQVHALVARGEAVVAAGRPSCFLCGNPIDPEGHVCPRLNGHPQPTP